MTGCLALTAAVVLLWLPGASAAASRQSPVTKVLEMLEEMKAKGEKDKAVEKMIFDKYVEWVDDYVKKLGFEIKTADSEIESLIASIEKDEDVAATVTDEIADIDAEVSRLEGDQKDITAEREGQNAEYMKVQQDYTESVDALERAIMILTSKDFDKPQALMMLQKMAKTTRGMARVLSLLELKRGGGRGGELSAPAVAAYEFQSGGIVDMLENLLDKFRSELAEVEKAEANSAHAFELENLHLSHGIQDLQDDREEKSAIKAKVVASSGANKGQLAEVKSEKADAERLMADTEATFTSKKATYEENQKVRGEEIEALAKAIEILSSPEVAESYKEHVGAAAAFLQISSTAAKASVRTRAAALLRKRASALASTTLAAAAQAVSQNPFAKVIDMIKELLAKLKEEAAAEQAHKEWCDEELRTNKLKREKKSTKVEKLRNEVDAMTGSIQTMAAEMTTLAEEQAALTEAMANATSQRSKEKAENTEAIKDAQEAQVAVKKALIILEEFYGKQGALVQVKQVPEMKAYSGMSKAKTGVLGMLEVILTDFARVEADTKAAESTAAREYDTFMSDSEASKKQKHDREFKLSLEKDQAEFDLSRLKDDLEATEEELDAANKYFESLKPQCLEVHVSYEERVAKRQEEIEALKQAYEILDGYSR